MNQSDPSAGEFSQAPRKSLASPDPLSGALALPDSASLDRLAGQRVLVLGDLMLDAYCLGETDRISPEAPVPVVTIRSEHQLLGGAGNVARNIAALGGRPTLIGTVGEDQQAERLRELLEADAVRPLLVTLPGRRTSVKTRIMAQKQQMLRLDREDVRPPEAGEQARLLERVEAALPEHEVLILSDYNKGLFSPTFMQALRGLVSGKAVRVLVDPKPANVALYEGVFLLTPNLKEAGACAGLPVRDRQEILAAGRAMMDRLHCDHLLVTLGADGMALFEQRDRVWHIPTFAQEVFDVTGAGDTVIAALSLALAAGLDVLGSAIVANYAAGLVVARVGAATASPDEIRRAMSRTPAPRITSWT